MTIVKFVEIVMRYIWCLCVSPVSIRLALLWLYSGIFIFSDIIKDYLKLTIEQIKSIYPESEWLKAAEHFG